MLFTGCSLYKHKINHALDNDDDLEILLCKALCKWSKYWSCFFGLIPKFTSIQLSVASSQFGVDSNRRNLTF